MPGIRNSTLGSTFDGYAFLGSAYDVRNPAWAGGAKGTGLVDDLPAFNACAAALKALPDANRPPMIVPAGTYLLAGEFVSDCKGLKIRGAGRFATVIKHSPPSPNMDCFRIGSLTWDDNTKGAYIDDIEISGMYIYTTSTNTRYLMRLNGLSKSLIANLEVHGTYNASADNIYMDYWINSRISHVLSGDSNHAGLKCANGNGPTTTVSADHVYLTSCLNGYAGGACVGMRFYNSILESNTGYGMALGESGDQNSAVECVACHFENNRSGTIAAGGNASGYSDVVLVGCTGLPINTGVTSPPVPSTYYCVDLGNAVYRECGMYWGGIDLSIGTQAMFRVNRGGTRTTTLCLLDDASAINSASGSFEIQNDGTDSPFEIPVRGVRRYKAASGTSFTPIPGSYQEYRYTATGASPTVNNPSAIANFPEGTRLRFVLIQDATGGRQWSFGSDFEAPTLKPGGANTYQVVEFERVGSKWHLTGGRPEQAFQLSQALMAGQIVMTNGGTPYASTAENSLDFNTGGTPMRVRWFTGANENMAIDANGSGFRFIVDGGESGGAVIATLSRAGALAGLASVAASGAITAGGALNGNSAAITNGVTAASMTATGAVQAGGKLKSRGASPYTDTDTDGGYPGVHINPGSAGVNPQVIFCTANSENMALSADSTRGLFAVTNYNNSTGGSVVGQVADRSGRSRMSSFAHAEQLVTFSATPAFDPVSGGQIRMILTNNVTSWTLAAGVAGQRCTILFQQDGTGSRTLAGTPANVRLAGNSLTLSTGANAVDAIVLEYNSSLAKWLEVARALNV